MDRGRGTRMKHIVIDLEMNPIAKEFKLEREFCYQEIIQIGAVILDDDYHEIGNFMTLVKPEYNNKIERNIEKLTAITSDMIQSAPVFKDAIKMFFDWCNSIPDKICFYQWSSSDRCQVTKELQLKNLRLSDNDQKILDSWEDFQYEFGSELGLDQSISLKNALMYAGLDFEGRQHDALYDARNTAELLHTVRDPELKQKALDIVIEALHPAPNCTIGDLFDFSQFTFGA